MIQTQGLVKKYGNLTAVDNLNLDIHPGQVYGFLGPNGAGKTTTLKMLAGLIQPSAGTIMMAGVDLAKEPERAKALIGYTPDRPSLYPYLTARETLKLVAGLYALPWAKARDRAEKLLENFGLANWGDELVETFSHGMKQKLVIAAALLHQPKVFLLDEPLLGLDPKGGRQVKDLLKGLAQRGGTVFVSIHTLEIAEKLCDRLGILHNGRLLAEGSPTEIGEMARRQGGGKDLEESFLRITGEDSNSTGAEGLFEENL